MASQQFITPSLPAEVFKDTPAMERYPSSGLDILVVGAGIAGLSFAIEAYRKGHQVRVIDRRPTLEDYGDLIAIQQSVLPTMKAWPDFIQRCHQAGVPNLGKVFRYDGTSVEGTPINFALPTTRSHFHSLLHLYVKHLGISIRYAARATEYWEDADRAGVVLEGGERLVGDVVVAADGIGSRSWNLVLGNKEKPISSGFAMIRCTFPKELALANPVVAASYNQGPEARLIFGPGAHMVNALTNDYMMFMLTHRDDSGSEEDWTKPTDPKKALRYVEKWAPWVHEMIKVAPENGAVDFKLMWRDPRETWCSPEARVIQIGDAAHTFLPTSASGATMAIEDAYSLAACLQLGGRSNVPLAIRVHNKLRFQRVTCAQKMGFKNREVLHNTDPDTIQDVNAVVPNGSFAGAWVLRHDPEQYAYEMYGQCANHILTGAPFANTNYPHGHTFTLWTVQEMLAKADRHESVVDDGDWS